MGASIRLRSKKSGLPPGSLIHVGQEHSTPPTLTVYTVHQDHCETAHISSAGEIAKHRTPGTLQWFDLQGTHDPAFIEALGDSFGIHPLVLEDIMNSAKRPKFEDLGDYLFIMSKMLYPAPSDTNIQAEQVSIIIGKDWVISCQEPGHDTFDAIRKRLQDGKGRLRTCCADFLGYSLLDSIVDGYFAVLERVGDELEAIERRVLQQSSERSVKEIHRAKRTVLFIRRAIWPLREAMSNFERCDSEIIHTPTKLFLRDAYDHAVEVLDIVENYRESCSALLDIYLSSMSNRLNSTMMVLTLVTTIFMPLTFIAGIYGMNFEHMPELKWRFGYPLILALMGAVAFGMLIFFRKRRWL